MDFQRIMLYAALSFTLFMLWSAWQKDYGPQPTAPVATVAAPGSAEMPAAAPTTPAASGTLNEMPATALQSGQRIHVVTDLFDAEIDTIGGDLRRVDLLNYPVSIDKKDEPFRLMNDGKGEYFVAQTALMPANQQLVAPSHYSEFKSAASEYRLQQGEASLTIPLVWKDGSGLEVVKSYTFHRDRYVVDVALEVRNGTQQVWQGYAYRQLQRTAPAEQSGMMGTHSYTGAVVSTAEKKYEKVDFKSMDKAALSENTQQGWVAMIQHYFATAWIPGQGSSQSYHFYSKALDEHRYAIGISDQTIAVEPGKSATIPAQLYVGPKIQERMANVAPNLELTVDYGWLTVIAKPLFWLLEKIHAVVGNWGWAIILLTILIKLAFFKLSAASYKSMAHMRQVQPKMAALKERYGDDKQKYQEAMMKLYKEEKINPLGGCLPILVQIPVFIALYYMLLESVEMRQAPFMLWIQDMSIADPYYVLPIIMGVTMLIQHKLNPSPLDPIQARVMMILPIVFTFFFLFFPAGLVLYWVVNNTLSIAQQWYITRQMEAAK